MGKTITNKPKGSKATANRRQRKRKGAFDNSAFLLPNDGAYIHSSEATFKRQLGQLTLTPLFEGMFQPFLGIIQQQRDIAQAEYKEIENPQKFLEHFSSANSQPLNDLRQIKNFLTVIGMARRKESSQWSQAMAVRTKNNVIHYHVPGYKAAPRQTAKKHLMQYLLAAGGNIFSLEQKDELEAVANMVLDTATNTINGESQFSSKSMVGDYKSLQVAYNKFKEHLALWSENNGDYRTANLKKLEDISTFSQFLSANHTSLGYFAEVLTAGTIPGTTVVGDADNKNTASDLETTLTTVDGLIVSVGQSIKFLKTDILAKEYSVTLGDIDRLVSNNLTLHQQLNYFLTNYLLQNYPASGAAIYSELKQFLQKVYFITLVFKGSAYHNMVNRNDALPMLLTVNQKTIFTFQLWDALLDLATNPGIRINLTHWRNAQIPDAEQVLQTVKEQKKKTSKRLVAEKVPLSYAEYLKDSELTSLMRDNMVFQNKYKTLSLGQVKVSIDMAKIINDAGSQ